jgi:hypothetical protein
MHDSGELQAGVARAEALRAAVDGARGKAMDIDDRLRTTEERRQPLGFDAKPETALRETVEKGLLEVALAVNRLTVVLGSRE